MKNFLRTALLLSVSLFFNIASAQFIPCGLDLVAEKARVKNPNLNWKTAGQEDFSRERKRKYAISPQAVATIPVVVHVVWNTAQENISDSQIVSQINVLNRDFRRMNADTSNTPAIFQTLAADPQIEFCLASVDPQGNLTNGITRTQTSKTSFNVIFGDTSIWHTSLGGYDGWDTSLYFNMWVCDMGPFTGGIGFWPGGTSLIAGSRDGVVINYIAFGTLGSATAPYNLGRTTTHEVGHYLDLHHLWGDVQNNSSCSADDFCNDTPLQVQATQTCPAFPFTDGCSAASPGIMFNNFMDYPPDNCRNFFTVCQSARMNAALSGPRASLLAFPAACTPVSTEEIFQEHDVVLFPNPSTGKFDLKFKKFEDLKIKNISIFNVLGETILSSTVGEGEEGIFDLTQQPDGIYFLKINTLNGIVNKKIVVVK